MTINAYGGTEHLIEELCNVSEGYWDTLSDGLATGYGREGGLATQMIDRDRSKAWGKANAYNRNKLRAKWAKEDEKAGKVSNMGSGHQGTLRALRKNGVTVHSNANWLGYDKNTHFDEKGNLIDDKTSSTNQTVKSKPKVSSTTNKPQRAKTQQKNVANNTASKTSITNTPERKPFGWNRPTNVFLAPDEIEGTDSSHLYSTPANKPQTSETETERLNRIHGGSSSVAQKTAEHMTKTNTGTTTQPANTTPKPTTDNTQKNVNKVTPEPTAVKNSKQ